MSEPAQRSGSPTRTPDGQDTVARINKAAVIAAEKEAKRLLDLHTAVLCHPSRRTHVQTLKMHTMVSMIPGPDQLGASALNHLVHCVQGVKYTNNEEVYLAGDISDAYYIIMSGVVTLFDSREKDDTESVGDPVVNRLGVHEGFGEEELISGGRRAYTATSTQKDTVLLRVRGADYRRTLEAQHRVFFDIKVEFLATLAPFRAITVEAVRKLVPAFHEVCFKKGECLVRQGDRADCMYAIKAGNVVVYVDPHHKEGSGLAELDPKKMMQVCMLDAGNIIGDMTVLANIKTRTASVVAATDCVAYRVRRALFLRRVPPDILEDMRRIATDKLRMTTKQVSRQPVVQSMIQQILQGHNLRELQQDKKKVEKVKYPEEYTQLIYLLRKQKRAPRPAEPRSARCTWQRAMHRPDPANSMTAGRNLVIASAAEAEAPLSPNGGPEGGLFPMADPRAGSPLPRPTTPVSVAPILAPLFRHRTTGGGIAMMAVVPPLWSSAEDKLALPSGGEHSDGLGSVPRMVGYRAIPAARTATPTDAYSANTTAWWTATFVNPKSTGGGTSPTGQRSPQHQRPSSVPVSAMRGGSGGGGLSFGPTLPTTGLVSVPFPRTGGTASSLLLAGSHSSTEASSAGAAAAEPLTPRRRAMFIPPPLALEMAGVESAGTPSSHSESGAMPMGGLPSVASLRSGGGGTPASFAGSPGPFGGTPSSAFAGTPLAFTPLMRGSTNGGANSGRRSPAGSGAPSPSSFLVLSPMHSDARPGTSPGQLRVDVTAHLGSPLGESPSGVGRLGAAWNSPHERKQIEDVLDNLALPLMETRVGHVMRKSSQHYRPTIPKVIL